MSDEEILEMLIRVRNNIGTVFVRTRDVKGKWTVVPLKDLTTREALEFIIGWLEERIREK